MAMTDKGAAAFWKKQSDFSDRLAETTAKESLDALRGLCRTLGIRTLPGRDVVEYIKGIDAEMKKRLTGR